MTRPSQTPEQILARVRKCIEDGNYGSACAEFLHLDHALVMHGPLPQDWGPVISAPAFPVPDSCQHYHVDNQTARCTVCNEAMIGITLTARTVASAPNLNPCTNPEHLAAIQRGESPECSQVFVPGPVRNITVGADPTYQCQRCEYSDPDGYQVIRADEPIVPSCGRSHRGQIIREGDNFKGVGVR